MTMEKMLKNWIEMCDTDRRIIVNVTKVSLD